MPQCHLTSSQPPKTDRWGQLELFFHQDPTDRERDFQDGTGAGGARAQLKSNTTQLGKRLETLEQRFDETVPTISLLKGKYVAQDQIFLTLLCQLDDFANRRQRANIHIHGLPKAEGPKDIIPILVGISK